MNGDMPVVSRFILEVVEKQLRENSPPETSETLDRLVGLGFSDEDARRLIGSAVVAEMRSVVAEGRSFSEERFLTLLRALPRLPS